MERVIQNPLLTDAEKISLLDTAIIAMQEKITEQDTRIGKHHKLLVEGNGELPAMERIRNLESFQNGLKFWLKTIAVALVLQTVTFAGAALIYFIRLYPILEQISKNP